MIHAQSFHSLPTAPLDPRSVSSSDSVSILSWPTTVPSAGSGSGSGSCASTCVLFAARSCSTANSSLQRSAFTPSAFSRPIISSLQRRLYKPGNSVRIQAAPPPASPTAEELVQAVTYEAERAHIVDWADGGYIVVSDHDSDHEVED